MKKVFKIEAWHFLVAFIALFVAVFFLGLNDLKTENRLVEGGIITDINPGELDDSVSSGISCVLFYSDDEDYSRKMVSNLAKLQVATKEQIGIFSVNADKHTGFDKQYDIMGSPALLIFNNGREVKRIMGVASVGTLKSIIKKYK